MKKIDAKDSFCQICAMPMETPETFGSNADGSTNKECCCYCYKNGKYTEPDITMEEMINKCMCIMKKMRIPESEIKQTKRLIPMLKRWKK
ncbi:MAG: zinc ribbon domain-containing protein [Thermoplasmata archaeon]